MFNGHQVALRAWREDGRKEICVFYARKSELSRWENSNNKKNVCCLFTCESGWEVQLFFSTDAGSVMRSGCIFTHDAFHWCGFLYLCIFNLVPHLITFGAALLTTKVSTTQWGLGADICISGENNKKKKKKTSSSHHSQARPSDNGQMTEKERYGCIPQLACKTNYLNSPTHSLSRSPSVSNGFLCECARVWEAKECAGVENVRTR